MELDLILEPDLSPSQIVELGQLAEGYGFRTLWIQNYARARDVFMSAIPLAMQTKTLRTGIVVVSPYEMHPLKIANAILTLAEYADGRADIVVGAGGEWNGVMGQGYGKRVSTAREALEIITKALHGESFNYEGDIFKAYGFATPWFEGKTPFLYSGASGPKLLKLSASHAQGVMMSDVHIPMFPNHLDGLLKALENRDANLPKFRINNFVAWHVKDDVETSYEEARRELIIRGWLEQAWLEPFLTPEEAEIVTKKKNAYLKAFRERHGNIEGIDPSITQKLVDGLSLAGDMTSIDDHIARLRQFGKAGFTEIALRIHDDPAHAIRTIGERVLPALR